MVFLSDLLSLFLFRTYLILLYTASLATHPFRSCSSCMSLRVLRPPRVVFPFFYPASAPDYSSSRNVPLSITFSQGGLPSPSYFCLQHCLSLPMLSYPEHRARHTAHLLPIHCPQLSTVANTRPTASVCPYTGHLNRIPHTSPLVFLPSLFPSPPHTASISFTSLLFLMFIPQPNPR